MLSQNPIFVRISTDNRHGLFTQLRAKLTAPERFHPMRQSRIGSRHTRIYTVTRRSYLGHSCVVAHGRRGWALSRCWRWRDHDGQALRRRIVAPLIVGRAMLAQRLAGGQDRAPFEAPEWTLRKKAFGISHRTAN